MTVTAPPRGSLLAQVLEEQADLSAVERFSQQHEQGLLPDTGRWRSLLPASRPGPGQQYGFEVDLDSCTGCKACVTACRSLNGLDGDESFRRVGLLHGGASASSALQFVTATCHHCLDPACLTGCPVDAYEKDPITGIVAHLDDQCIGCGYCTFTCPYEVPRFNHARGIVRKCDMCAGRLAVGEAPACAQACPNEALQIVLVDTVAVRAAASIPGATLVPGAAPSVLTSPTTAYRSVKPVPADAYPADRFAAIPSKSHPPLAVMLVLTQLSVGAFAADLALRFLGGDGSRVRPANALTALVLGLLALGASVLHLGRPHLAWRAVIGLRHSWLSREIVAFTLFAALATADAAALALSRGRPSALADGLGMAVVVVGLGAVTCSVMIYAVTGRPLWALPRTALRFGRTVAACGLATTLAVSLTSAALGVAPLDMHGSGGSRVTVPLALALAAVVAAELVAEVGLLRSGCRAGSPVATSVRILRSPELRTLTRWRFALAAIGGIALPLGIAAAASGSDPAPGWCAAAAVVAAVAVTAGELCERTGFFAAAVSPAMPRELP